MKNLLGIYTLLFILIFLLGNGTSIAQFDPTPFPYNNLTSVHFNDVGIGLTDPEIERRLHVFKRFTEDSYPNEFYYKSIGVRLDLGFNNPSIRYKWDLAVVNDGSFHIYDVARDKSPLTIKNNGYVGIGNVTAQGRMDIRTGQTFDHQDALFVSANATTVGIGGIIHHQNDTYAWQEIAQNTAYVNNSTLRFNFVTRNNPGEQVVKQHVFVIHSAGRVGVNTYTPTYSLDVNGDARMTSLDVCELIRAEEVKVELASWCDYVFADDYKLRSLDEVEAFINDNHHLPEVPSTAEVVENGLDLGSMNAVLLKKVEELTLYVIEQNKRIAALEKESSK